MGIYLNGKRAYSLFQEDCAMTYYIDKTEMLDEIVRILEQKGNAVEETGAFRGKKMKYLCVTRPRRFGKTLNLSMLECFFSNQYAGRSDLFEGLSVWREEKYRSLQGTYPVIALSFANVKETTYQATRKKICEIITDIYNQLDYLADSKQLNDNERMSFRRNAAGVEGGSETSSLKTLAYYLMKHYGKRVIILLDEYDTPMQEAYVNGYRDEMTAFIRSLFNSTFKTSPYHFRVVMTGITRISKESVFSDLNNLTVITTTSDAYRDFPVIGRIPAATVWWIS